ncbi:glycosyltransferase family 4 protein [Pseudonocardia asaccharolytica]|uniref:Glycosyltransferase WbuB n=1 Tax=Pseudonocardia asaccharolytica DSM 44247 = NBRC 16224 TaxID=1123024 RepID=A0A511DAR6_9PSEU|nr:glycosyltransferase family 4 protein [Pseudonocardia asaccharolytica]GEL20048.1 glycosyltransferase WbuB [Pseudonocardia asaccharolytica DSM 44247 = NBRC 16224]
MRRIGPVRHARHVCIVVQNLPVPFDRRVWLECRALRAAGYEVSVVCPRGRGEPARQELDGVRLFRYSAFPPITRQAMFVAEYAWSILATLVRLVQVWRERRFGVVQVCNPPDVLCLAVLPFQVLFGVRLVFDQHDLCPELYESRFPDGARLPHRALRATEWLTYRLSAHVIATNESYRRVALGRGGKRPDEVTVVRTGPDPDRMRRGSPDPALRRGREHLLIYLGVMGPQDGVDITLRAMRHIVHVRKRSDVALTLIGDGDDAARLRRLASELGLDGWVEFTGRAPDELVARLLSTADIGLSPDPKNPLNDVSTMNKTMEYLAFELPVVAFDLVETRVSAADAAAYAEPNRVDDYADTILALLDDEVRRKQMGARGRRRVETVLAWDKQIPAYVGVYDPLAARG